MKKSLLVILPYLPLILSSTLIFALLLGEQKLNNGLRLNAQIVSVEIDEKMTRAATRARLREKSLYTPLLTVSVEIDNKRRNFDLNASRELMFYTRKDAEDFLAPLLLEKNIPVLLTGRPGHERAELLIASEHRTGRKSGFILLAGLVSLPSLIWIVLTRFVPPQKNYPV